MILDWARNHADEVWDLTLTHLWLVALSTVVGLIISIPLGYLAHRYPRLHLPLVGGTGLFFTFPSLALFILLPKILGTKILDPMNVVVALTIYTIALLTRVVADGLGAVPPESVQAAEGIGYTGPQIFVRVQLPLAVPAIMSGLRVVVVTNISIATMAAVIGVAQLGTLFTMGFSRNLLEPIIVGLIVSLLLALILDRVLVLVGHALTPWERRKRETRGA